jgi:hypothetical protein
MKKGTIKLTEENRTLKDSSIGSQVTNWLKKLEESNFDITNGSFI